MPTQPDTTPLLVVAPRREPPEGATTIAVNLMHFFALVTRIGRDPALLLLTIRATRVRTASLYGLQELAWMLRARHREVRAWLDHLSRERLVTYQLTEFYGRDAMLLEILSEPVIPPPPREAQWDVPVGRHIEHALPAFWFTTTLPLVGRTAFLVYLLLRRAEMDDAAVVHTDGIAEALGLPSGRHGRRHLRHLGRHGLVGHDRRRRALIVVDPPPPTRWQRLKLRLLELGFWPRLHLDFVIAAVLIAALVTLALAQHAR